MIPAEEAPSLGGAAALGDGYALVWRVCESERQQCLELEELLTAAEVARGRMRIFLGEQIVDVKCLVGASAVVLIVCTLTSVHLAYVELAEDQTLLDTLFPGSGVRMSCGWSQLPAWRQVFDTKEGQSILCLDARLPERGHQVEVFLGTNAGMTVSLSIGEEGPATTNSELRQTSGGFSLFRSPTKALTNGQRVTCVVVDGMDKLLTLSEDGKVKRWNTRTSKCLAERSVSLDQDLGTGRLISLVAFKMCLMPRQGKVVFALRAEDASSANQLVQCSLQGIANLQPKDQVLDDVQMVVQDGLEKLGDKRQVLEVKSMGAAVLWSSTGKDEDDEILVSGWQGASASVIVMTRLEDGTTERVFTQCAELQSQIELAAMYRDKWGSGSGGGPDTLKLIQDTVLRGRRFSSAVLHSSLQQLFRKYHAQEPPLKTWPAAWEADYKMQDLVYSTIERLVDVARVPLLHLWHEFLIMCGQTWRAECDGLLAIKCIDLGVSNCVLVKHRGLSVLRLGSSTEAAFLRIMVDGAEADRLDNFQEIDAASVSLSMAYKSLAWMEPGDPGGVVFSERLMTEDAQVVLESMLAQGMRSCSEPPIGLDPDQIVRDHPQLLTDANWDQSQSFLCQSLAKEMTSLALLAAPEGGLAPGPPESSWVQALKQDVCERLVMTHYEIVRGISLALGLVEYHLKTTGDLYVDETLHPELTLERLQDKLRDCVLPLLSSYHILRWGAGRRLWLDQPCSAPVSPDNMPVDPSSSRTWLSLCIGKTQPDTLADLIKDPIPFICDPIAQGTVDDSLILRAFMALRRDAGDDSKWVWQWQDLLNLCKHPGANSLRPPMDAGMLVSDSTASDAWWFHTVVVAYVQGCACLCLATPRWKEASEHFSDVLHGTRRLMDSRRVLVPPHPLLTLQDQLLQNPAGRRCGHLQACMRQVTSATPWGPSLNNLLDYFLFLHDHGSAGSKGLLHSLRELLLPRMPMASQLRAPAGMQNQGQKTGPASTGAIECYGLLMQLAMESLSDLEVQLTAIYDQYHVQGGQNDAECVFALDCLRYLMTAARHFVRVSWLAMYTDCGLFDEAYDLIAESISACGDDDINKMRMAMEADSGDEYRDVVQWLTAYSSMDLASYHQSELKMGIERKLKVLARKEAYRCLEGFVSAQGLQARPDKLCSYPWVNCSHTVDTLLRERCESKEHLEEAYNVRYAFNIARSDYRTAADTMMTYWFNFVDANFRGDSDGAGIGGMPDNGQRVVDLGVLLTQANSCLAAINCYSLLEARFAYWIPPTAAIMPEQAEDSKKRHADGMAVDGDWLAAARMRTPDVITLPMMLQHYALLRARIRLAEFEALAARDIENLPPIQSMHLHDRKVKRHRMVPVSPALQQVMAEETVAHLLKVGLVDDAISLAAAFSTSTSSTAPAAAPGSLTVEEMCKAVTERCLQSLSSPHAAPLIDEDGVTTPADDAWEFLRRFLIHFDGSAKASSLAQQLPHMERESAQALETNCPRPFGRLARIAAESFLRLSPDPDSCLPPWLVYMIRAGTRHENAAAANVGFDAEGGDTCGLLRLLVRYDRLEEASQLVVNCLTLEREGIPVVPRKTASVKTLPSVEECLIMDLSKTRYVPYNLIDQLIHRLRENSALDTEHRNTQRICLESVQLALDNWLRFTQMESEMVSSFCCCPQVNARVNQVLSATGIDPASGERDPMRGDVDIRTLLESITKQITETTPIGKRFERLETAQGQPVTRADRELVFERLCLQMLQRTRPRMCPSGGVQGNLCQKWQTAWDASRQRSHVPFAAALENRGAVPAFGGL